MLETATYCPLLHARVAEVKALAQLPAATKDLLFPVLVARPWPNAKQLSLTWDRLAAAFEGRRFALDLDRTRHGHSSDKPAAAEFNALFAPDGAYANYYSAVEAFQGAVPVLRANSDGVSHLEAQLGRAETLNRGLFVRLEYGFTRSPLSIVDALIEHSIQDLVLYIDAGWSRELLLREAWATAIVEKVASSGIVAEVVLCGSSFPDTFEGVGLRGEIQVKERKLYADIVRRFNAPPLKYGDWGSTRAPALDSTPMTPRARIDLPLPEVWLAFRGERNEEEVEDYQSIATRLVADRSWPTDLNIWGTYMIQSTVEQAPGCISSPAAAAAARINIHMHRQAYFEAPVAASDADEPFTDDL